MRDSMIVGPGALMSSEKTVQQCDRGKDLPGSRQQEMDTAHSGGGISFSLFKFVHNRIPLRLGSRLAETKHHGQFNKHDGNTRQAGRLMAMRSHGRLDCSTEGSDEQIPESPPPVYRSESSLATPSSASADRNEYDGEIEQDHTSEVAGRIVRGTCERRELNFAAGSSAGVRVGFANQGLILLHQSTYEAHQNAMDCLDLECSPDQPLARLLYVHGIQYLLRGLPNSLSNDEAVAIWGALPPQVRDVAVLEATDQAKRREPQTLTYTEPGTSTSRGRQTQVQSALHRLVALLTMYIILSLQFLAPHIQYLLARAWDIQQEHKLLQVLSGWTTGQAVKIGNFVYKMNDGKVGMALAEAVVWWIDGISGGVRQGLGDVMTQRR